LITLEIKNLGIIKEAFLHIKPFNVFIGENNSNKSWTAYSIYGILHRQNIKNLTEDYLNLNEFNIIEKSKVKDFINITIEKLINSPSNSLEIQDIGNIFSKYINDILKDLSKVYSKKFISTFLGVNEKLFKNTELNLQLTEDFIQILKEELIKSSVNIEAKGKNFNLIKVYKGKNEKNLIIEVINVEEIPIKHLKRLLSDLLLNYFTSYIFLQKNIFPSERKALATFSERLQKIMVSKLPTSENLPYELLFEIILKEEFDFPIFLEDFIRLVSELKKNKESKYKEVLKYIEKIIDGSITFDENHEFIMYKQKGLDIELPVYSTSSMVKSLSVFYLYLSKLAQGKDLIVLDEPEMNLHPKAQTEFLELLTIFINGLDREDRNLLILTTHTPYILDHLENLINAFDISKNLNAHELKQLKENFFLKTEKAFINPKNVAVYHFRKDGKVENIFNEEEKSINEETFFNISDKILDISSTIESLKIKKLLNN